MKSLTPILVMLVLTGCQSAPRATDSEPDETTPTETTPDEPELAWNPGEPVDLDTLTTTRRFVVATETSICPTRAGVESGDCGQSVEFADRGDRVKKGAVVTTIGEPIDGMTRAIRYTKPGTLPGWIASDAIADRPDLAGANAAANTWREDPSKTESMRFIKARSADMMLEYDEEEGRPTGRIQIVDDGKALMAVVPHGLMSADGVYFGEWHLCLVEGDCDELDYVCGDDYCDEPYIVVEPSDSDGDWVIKALADRNGVFTTRALKTPSQKTDLP